MLTIEQKRVDEVLIVSVDGQVNTDTSSDLRDTVFDNIDRGARKVVIDCTGMTYISSAGLRVLMIIASKLKPLGGTMGLSSIQTEILKHLDEAGFLGLFNVYKDVDEAIAQ